MKMNHRHHIALLASVILFTPFCQAMAAPCNDKDTNAIDKTIMVYVKKNTAISTDSVKIMAQNCVATYAAATVHPVDGATDDAKVYLHKIDKNWKVIAFGTDFDEKVLSALPEELKK